MTYNLFNIADEIKVMNLCSEIVALDRQIEALRLKINKLRDEKLLLEVEIDKIREARRDSLKSGTEPIAPPPPPMP